MITFSIRDRAFAHCGVSNSPMPQVSFSKYIAWDRESPASKRTIYTDAEIRSAPVGSTGWLIEPLGDGVDILDRLSSLHRVWTWDDFVLTAFENARFVPFGGCWIEPDDRGVWPKSKLVSTVASNKRGGFGYDLRHDAISALASAFTTMDAYGVDYTTLPHKIDSLSDYRFQLVIENVRRDFWFTEKLIDCFATGTIPIYWGCPSIGLFFDLDGIIVVRSLEEIVSSVCLCTPELYASRQRAIEKNFELAKRYYLAEDWIFENSPELLRGLELL